MVSIVQQAARPLRAVAVVEQVSDNKRQYYIIYTIPFYFRIEGIALSEIIFFNRLVQDSALLVFSTEIL